MFLIFVVIFCSLTISKSAKLFIPNTNFNNKINWKAGKLPCEHSNVIFPQNIPSVLLNGSREYKVAHMILPENGELLLGDGTLLTVASDADSGTCEPIEAVYIRAVDMRDSWYDPANWCEVQAGVRSCGAQWRGVEATLVPSSFDTAIFRTGAVYYVTVAVHEPPISVSELVLRGQAFRNSHLLRKKLQQRTNRGGRKRSMNEFVRMVGRRLLPPVIKLGECWSEINCIRNSNLKIMSTICAYVTCDSTAISSTRCSTVVQPKGSCCKICAINYNLEFLIPTEKSDFMSKIKRTLREVFKNSLVISVLTTDPKAVQLTISSSNRNEIKNLKTLDDKIINWIIKSKLWIITKINGNHLPSSATFKQIKPTRILIILLLIVFALGVLIILLYFARHRLSPQMLPLPSLPSLPTIRWPQFRIPSLWWPSRNQFSKSKLQEDSPLDDQFTFSVEAASIVQSHRGTEDIELPETMAGTHISRDRDDHQLQEISFSNPVFSAEPGSNQDSDIDY